MLRIERSADGEDVRFTITGRVEAVHVAELQRLIEEETAARRPIVLDLKEVKLVDREAVSFFVRCEAGRRQGGTCRDFGSGPVRASVVKGADRRIGERPTRQSCPMLGAHTRIVSARATTRKGSDDVVQGRRYRAAG
jgi:anti-anti-sigma regulatory factor